MSDWKLLAIKLGDVLKTETTVNGLERVASAVFPFPRNSHPNAAITSRIAGLVYDWVLTLEQQELSDFQKKKLLQKFVDEAAPPMSPARALIGVQSRERQEYPVWGLIHPEVQRVARKRFDDGHYADAVEAALKEVNSRVKKIVRLRTSEELDGADLMHHAFSPKKPVIVLGDLSTETGRNIQQGYMEIFAGSMTGIRNPKAHEVIEIGPDRALHFLMLASLLMHKLDESFQARLEALRPIYESHNAASARGWPAEKQCQCADCKDYRTMASA